MGKGVEVKKYFSEAFETIRANQKVFLILLLILLFGAYLRAYHIDYPVVGYHNWKETHYLTEARNFARDGFFKYGFFVPAYDYPGLDTAQSGAHADTFPVISVLASLFFKIFGIHLWAARIIGILFSIGSVAVMYLFVKRLFKRDDIALLSAFITALLPLYVFFSHNMQMQNPGLFFMLSGAYFYLRWHESDISSELILSALFISLAGLTNYPFLVILIPIFLTFPFERLKKIDTSHLKTYAISIFLLALMPLWVLYSKHIAAATGRTTVSLGLIKIYPLFTKQWWVVAKAYAADNYTLLGVFLALVGLISIGIFYKIKAKFEEKFVLAYALAALVFVMVMSEKLGGHSYHYFPIAPLFVILMSYALFVISTNISNFFTVSLKENKERTHAVLKYGTIIIILYFLATASFAAKNRQFDTQFFGLDVAGEYIKEHSQPSERVIFSGGQSFGVLWHADRKGYYPIPSAAEIQKAEQLGASWIFMYAWGLNDLNDAAKMEYINKNYGLVQLGFQQSPDGKQSQLLWLLLKKGGTFDFQKINEYVQNKPSPSKDYELSKGVQKIYYINVVE